MHAGAEPPVTNSGGSWTQRQGMHFRRLCARPGCGKPATATLRFQPTLRQAWLVDLDDSASRTQGDLCRRHAADLVLPRGWELHDERTTAPRPVDESAPASAPPARRVRVRRRRADSEPAQEPDQLPGFAPVLVPSTPEVIAAIVEAVPAVEEEATPPEEVEVEEAAREVAEPATSRAVPAQFGSNDEDGPEVDDSLNTILDARTPLLQRAFRNAKPEETDD
jgi:hypothetical protein